MLSCPRPDPALGPADPRRAPAPLPKPQSVPWVTAEEQQRVPGACLSVLAVRPGRLFCGTGPSRTQRVLVPPGGLLGRAQQSQDSARPREPIWLRYRVISRCVDYLPSRCDMYPLRTRALGGKFGGEVAVVSTRGGGTDLLLAAFPTAVCAHYSLLSTREPFIPPTSETTFHRFLYIYKQLPQLPLGSPALAPGPSLHSPAQGRAPWLLLQQDGHSPPGTSALPPSMRILGSSKSSCSGS